MSDVMHGPSVIVDARAPAQDLPHRASSTTPRASCRTPPSPSSENTAAFLPVLKQAVLRRGHPQAPLRRQRRRLPLPAPRAGVRQARHRAHPRPALPAAGQRGSRSAGSAPCACSSCPPSAPRTLDEPRRAEPPAVGLGRGRVPPARRTAASTARRPLDRWAHAPPTSVRYARAPTSMTCSSSRQKRRVQTDRTVSLDGVAYRGRRRARRRDRHPALRPRAARHAPRRGLAPRRASVETRKRVDAYANCFVKPRPPPRRRIVARQAAPATRLRPGLRLRDARRRRRPDEEAR